MNNLTRFEMILRSWCEINTGSRNHDGQTQIQALLAKEFGQLPATSNVLDLPTHPALHIKKNRPKDAPKLSILFVGHTDTVFSQTHSFQSVTQLEGDKLSGPGILDMKAGILILLESLKTMESQPWAKDIYWEVLLTSDEEIGSPDSKDWLVTESNRFDIGLVFEPCLENGNFISDRKGSTNIKVTTKGKAAHVGRAIKDGVNAIDQLVSFLGDLVSQKKEGLIINVGTITGGEKANIVPDYAECMINIRGGVESDINGVLEWMEGYKPNIGTLEIECLGLRPPKPLTPEVSTLLGHLKEAGTSLGQPIDWESSGGVCDGNFMAAGGLPTIDTLGAIGKGMHTDTEYIDLTSIEKRVALTVAFLERVYRAQS
ncbi:M20/M25/M40 family metallo-hydrolase [bacterium]|jgi:glutamate carboxypeptidase|nr:M20/M25/M40 family metallo-hydrolase [bacterium]